MTILIILIKFFILVFYISESEKIRMKVYSSSRFCRMSIMIKKFFSWSVIFLTLLMSIAVLSAQDLEVAVKLFEAGNSRVVIEGKFLNDNDLIGENWSFLQNYADAENLGKRIVDLKLFDKNEKEIPFKKFTDGIFVADRTVYKFSYTFDADVLDNQLLNAHVSWLDKTHGLLMLNDLLPQFSRKKVSAKITFEIPDGWKISTSEKSVENKIYSVKNTEDAVFLLSEKWREKEFAVKNSKINVLILDEWQFEDETAYEMAEEIVSEYAELFGEVPFENAQIVLMNFPGKFDLNRWRAETRGTNVTILSTQTFAESSARQRLHEQLRHEIFHLWIPNSLNLSGEYAWFYEGFAIYQALRTGVQVGQIRFADFLNTLEQAYFLDQKRSTANSLLDISKMRWNGEVSSVYAKGMLVAFLCDTAIMRESKGRRDLENIFREVYRKHGKFGAVQDANTSVMNVLQEYDELAPIIKTYIKGTQKIDWTNYISVLGIENIGSKQNPELKLRSKLSGSEKALLKKLGYNKPRKFIRQKVNKN